MEKSIVFCCFVVLQEEVDLLPNLQRLFLSFNCIKRYDGLLEKFCGRAIQEMPFAASSKDALGIR